MQNFNKQTNKYLNPSGDEAKQQKKTENTYKQDITESNRMEGSSFNSLFMQTALFKLNENMNTVHAGFSQICF